MLIDDDTFIHPWNLVSWLSTLDWRQHQLIGSNAKGEDFTFGGAGTLISHETIRLLLQKPQRLSSYSFNTTTEQWQQAEGLNNTVLDDCIMQQWGGK